MQKYVVGFLFDLQRENLVLIQKTKPEWQNGCFNGVGGKVEPNESFIDAMIREFKEETNLDVTNWKLFSIMKSIDDSYEIYIYCAFEDRSLLLQAETTTEEQVKIIPLYEVWSYPLISNLNWLIPLALDENVMNATIIMIADE